MKTRTLLSPVTALVIAGSLSPLAHAAKQAELPLSSRGKELEEKYTEELEGLRDEVISALPELDEAKKARFLEVRSKWDGLKSVGDDTPPAEKKAHDELKEQIDSESMEIGADLLAELAPVLSSDALDAKLMRIAVLTHGTPRGLAEFAQKGVEQEKLLETFFGDEELMRQVLEAGGANGGEYGEMMEVYTAILEASERARERGTIFHRLALGMAIQMPWLNAEGSGGADGKAGIHGILFNANSGIEQVPRYLHYEKAFLDGELDPAFPDLNTWECRYVANDGYSNEDLAWFRQMLRIYRPDHITTDDYKWRYIRIVKSDVPYCSPTTDPSLGTPAQQHIALGGICGRRAYYGRFSTRAFGIPSRQSTQTAHGAMNHWTPDGWVICLGAWWSVAYCGPWGGLDFLLDSQAREFDDYQLVRRAQWIADAFAEPDTALSNSNYGKNGGFWNSLAFVKKQLMVKEAKVKALELVGGMKLGESDDLIGDEEGEDIEIPDEFKEVTVSDDGTITLPAVAAYSPRKSSDRILFLKSWDEGYQLHYSRLGQRPELFKYRIEVPVEGEYELTALAATVSPDLEVLVRINRDEPGPFAMPYTKGMWESSEPIRVKLSEGRNMISVTARTPNRGVSIKHWQLKPVK
ncbi:hypothetical protein HAHE_29760 [Haloferula helveola]|uniref:Uncharacterized protein n=1 Tax=Haloferula helveola TaxID=490095 RepID=A0ABM7RGX2_9BACT|nr:hypothetical protein HAHE_29760 [Haloferula helveola]